MPFYNSAINRFRQNIAPLIYTKLKWAEFRRHKGKEKNERKIYAIYFWQR